MGLRIALVNPASLVGDEIRLALDRRRSWWREVTLFTTDADQVGAVTEVAGTATLVQALEEGSLAGFDLVFLCGARDTSVHPPPGGTMIVATDQSVETSGLPLVAGINLSGDLTSSHLVSAHPAVILLANVLHPLREFGPSAASATLIQPASALSRAALDELLTQTRAILAFAEERPQHVFGRQMAFNLVPTSADTAAIAEQLDHVLGEPQNLSATVLQAGIFHSLSLILEIRFENDPGIAALRAALESNEALELREEAPGPIDVAGRDEILMLAPQVAPGAPGGYWLWAVMDNLTRGGALNALAIARAVAVPGEE